MWFNRIKSAEFKELDKKFSELEASVKEYRRKVDALDVDMSLFWDKLNKAIKRKMPAAASDQGTEDLNDSVLLPDHGHASSNLGRKSR